MICAACCENSDQQVKEYKAEKMNAIQAQHGILRKKFCALHFIFITFEPIKSLRLTTGMTMYLSCIVYFIFNLLT